LGVELLSEGETSGLDGAGVGHQHGVLEMGNHIVFLLLHDGVGGQKFVLNTFFHADLGRNLVFETSLREAQDGVSGDHIVKESTGSFGLQHIRAVYVALIHSAS